MQLVLPALEAQWVRFGAPIAERLRPGLSAVQLNDIEASLSFGLPHELRELWAWHDGSEIVVPHCTIGPGAPHRSRPSRSGDDVIRPPRTRPT
jgi:hypothetical protein